MKKIRDQVNNCTKCGPGFGKSACGFGVITDPLIFFIGQNPWVHGHRFDFARGRGIAVILKRFREWKFNDFYFDNVFKCQVPKGLLTNRALCRCIPYLHKQIQETKPKNLIIFGKVAAEAMGLYYEPWAKATYADVPTRIVPHFSAHLYQSKGAEEIYYVKLKLVIDYLRGDEK